MADGMKKFSPVRMTASTEEAAVRQALDLIGAARDEVDVEVLEQGAKGVTVRVGPRGFAAESAPALASTPAPVAAEAEEPKAQEPTAQEPEDEEPEGEEPENENP